MSIYTYILYNYQYETKKEQVLIIRGQETKNINIFL